MCGRPDAVNHVTCVIVPATLLCATFFILAWLFMSVDIESHNCADWEYKALYNCVGRSLSNYPIMECNDTTLHCACYYGEPETKIVCLTFPPLPESIQIQYTIAGYVCYSVVLIIALIACIISWACHPNNYKRLYDYIIVKCNQTKQHFVKE